MASDRGMRMHGMAKQALKSAAKEIKSSVMRVSALAALLSAATVLAAAQGRRPERIVSLAPSMTEILFALGLGERVVAVTTYCDYPPEALKKPKVGSWARPDLERIVAKSPQLVAATTHVMGEAVFKRLEQLGIPVFDRSVESLEEIFEAIVGLAAAAGVAERGRELLAAMQTEMDEVRLRVKGLRPVSVAFVVGHRDLIVVGGGSFLNELIRIAGGRNIAGKLRQAYARYSYEKIIQARPEIIIDTAMGTEGKSALKTRKLWSRWPSIPAVRNGRIYGMETGIILKPGPRVHQTVRVLAALFHPEAFEQRD